MCTLTHVYTSLLRAHIYVVMKAKLVLSDYLSPPVCCRGMQAGLVSMKLEPPSMDTRAAGGFKERNHEVFILH